MDWDSFILMALKILAVFVLVLLNGFFCRRRVRARPRPRNAIGRAGGQGQRRAKLARHIVRNLNSYLSATQLGITMASLGLGWIGQPVFTTLLTTAPRSAGRESGVWQHSISFAVGFSALTFLTSRWANWRRNG